MEDAPMTATEKMLDLKTRMEANVRTCILPFWRQHMVDEKAGGFYGMVDDDLCPVAGYPKALVLNTRMLWSYSSAWRHLQNKEDKILASYAFDYIKTHFWDEQFGGVYWMLNSDGVPIELEKRTYAQAFIIYSMAEYYRVSGKAEALDMAMQTFRLVNEHAKYPNGGYADSVQRDWRRDDWVWRWFMNANGAAKLLNSHLHLFEATITLYEVTGDPQVGAVLAEFLAFLLDVAVDKNLHHLKAGMDEAGNRIDNEISFGHDAECCYLLVMAADLLGDEGLKKRAAQTALDIMAHVYEEGLDRENGGLFNEQDCVSGHLNRAKVWWVQAEGITSFFNCYQLSGDEKYLDAAIAIWDYVEKYVVDYKNGEWFAVGTGDGAGPEAVAQSEAVRAVCAGKASKAKCPYHNARACFEIMDRVGRMLDNQ